MQITSLFSELCLFYHPYTDYVFIYLNVEKLLFYKLYLS